MKAALTLVLALMACTPGRAETLYRCVDRHAQVSYQSAACGSGQRTARTIEFEPEPVSPATTAKIHIPTRTTNLSRTRSSGYASRTPQGKRKRGSDVCRAAKNKRQTQLERLGLSRTFDDLSRIDAAVRAACNGY